MKPSGLLPLVRLVSLPWGRIQEIKCMTLVNFTHGLFLTFTQKSHYIYRSFIAIFTRFTAFLPDPTPYIFIRQPCPLLTLENQLHCSWWRIPIWSANNCPTLCFAPLTLANPTGHQQFLVIFVRDKTVPGNRFLVSFYVDNMLPVIPLSLTLFDYKKVLR